MSVSLVRAALAGALAVLCWGPTGPASAAAPTCDGVRATIVGTAADDVIVGTPGRDVIRAGPGDDVVRAGGGDDLVCGNTGADVLLGEEGDDRLLGLKDAMRVVHGGVVRVGDMLRGGPGDDVLDVGTDPRPASGGVVGDRVSWSTSAGAVRVDLGVGTATGEGHDTIVPRPHLSAVGSSYADVLVGSEGPDTLIGGPGDDTIEGRGGDDLLRPEGRDGTVPTDDDVVDGGPGADRIRSRSGRDVLRGGAGADDIASWSGSRAEIRGGDGDDALSVRLSRAGAGGVLDGGTGTDRAVLRRPGARSTAAAVLDLSAGTLRIAWPARTTSTVAGLEAVVLAPHTTWEVWGSSTADTVVGGPGSWLRAHLRAGDDTVTGTAGDDWIDGGAGHDRADTGSGHDVCRAVEVRTGC